MNKASILQGHVPHKSPHSFYNENDPYAAAWLRNLIEAGHIAPGTVDDRSILDVTPTDLAGYDRCHFFAGIAGWDYALQLAGWLPEWPAWTGSCPCQPFSTAGKRGKGSDERHLWPYWFHLIRVCKPPIIFGEQVASKDGFRWLDLVCSDLEAEGYAVGAVIMPAWVVGSPQHRERIYFVAHTRGKRSQASEQMGATQGTIDRSCGTSSGMGSMSMLRKPFLSAAFESCLRMSVPTDRGMVNRPIHGQGWWEIGPQVFYVVNGFPGRMEQLRAYGNAIVPQVGAEFIRAVMDLL